MPKLFVPTPNVVEVTFQHFGYDSVNMCHVLHLLNNNPPTTGPQVNDLIGNLSNWYAVQVMPFISSYVQYDTATCRPIDEPDLFETIDHAHIVHGGINSLAMPNMDSFRLNLYTGVPGRSFRGAKNISGIPRLYVSGNRVDASWAALIRAAWYGLIPIATGLGWTWCVLSKEADGEPRAEGVVTPITAVEYKTLVLSNQESRAPAI